MIIIFVFADLCVAIGIVIGFTLFNSWKGKEPSGVNYGIPQQPSVPPMPERLPELDEAYKLSKYGSMNKAREYMGIPEMPKKEGW